MNDNTAEEQILAWMDALDQFENKTRGAYQAEVAAQLVAELRATMSSVAPVTEKPGKVVITTNIAGHCVAVTRQDEEGRILSVIWSAEKPPELESAMSYLRLVDAMGYCKGTTQLEWTPEGWAEHLYKSYKPIGANEVDKNSIELLDRLLMSYSWNSHIHWQYVGKPMPEDVYEKWAKARDETIPALKKQVIALFKAA